jgi:hypothetical protein
MPDERLPVDRAVRVLRAKAGELEARVLQDYDSYPNRLANTNAHLEQRLMELGADIALVATILPDHMERAPHIGHRG